MKTRLFDKEKGHYSIYCPGCNESHVIAVDQPFSNGARWGFNGNLEFPTFTPSLVVKSGKYVESADWYNSRTPEEKQFTDKYSFICHSYITDGKIQFLSDCTHSLANQTVDLLTYL